MLDELGQVTVDGIIFSTYSNGGVWIALVGSDERRRIHIDELAQYIDEARAYMGQPVLADEMSKLADAFACLGLSVDAPGERRAYSDCARRLRECLSGAESG